MRSACYLLLVLLVSCSSEIELDQPDYSSKVVVDGYIESDGFAHIYLTRSSPFLTEYDSLSILKSFLNTAAIKLTCSNGDSEYLTLFRESSFFPPFVYKSIRMKGIPGETYSLEIRTGGRIITASTTIPQPPNLTKFEAVALSDSSCRFKLSMIPPVRDTAYMYVQYKSQKADKNFHPSGVPVFKLEDVGEVLSIMVYRCNESNLYFAQPTKKFYHGWPKNDFSLSDTVLVKAGRVDVKSYQIIKSLFADQSIKDNPFAFNMAGIQTNVVGGIGRWTGIGMAPTQLFIRH